nr:hypothetical protein [uncultured Mediterranean phage uvMED]
MTTSYQSFNRGGQFQRSQVDLGSQQQERVNAQNVEDLERNSKALYERDLQAARDTQKAAEGLANFSTSLSDILITRQKEENEKQKLEGMREYWLNGASEEEQAAFKESEGQLNDARAVSDKAAGDYEANGGDTFVAEGLRNLSGWKAYGFAKAMLQQAGNDYGTFQVQRGDQLGINNISDPRERAAVQQQIREEYLQQYAEINPVLLDNYLFPTMRKFEQADTVAFANRQAKQFAANRALERSQSMVGVFQSTDPTTVAEGILEWEKTYLGQFNGNRKLARAAAMDEIQKGIQNKTIDGTALYNGLTLSNIEQFDGSGFKSLATMHPTEYGALVNMAESAYIQDVNQTSNFILAKETEKYNNFVQAFNDSDRSEATLQEMLADGPQFTLPQFKGKLAGLVTNEDHADTDTLRQIDEMVQAGFHPPASLINKINDKKLREETQRSIGASEDINPPTDVLESNYAKIEGHVRGMVRKSDFDGAQTLFGIDNTKLYYLNQYRLIKAQNPGIDSRVAANQAMALALAEATKNKKESSSWFNPPIGFENKNRPAFDRVSKALANGTDDWRDGLEGLDKQAEELNESLKARTGIPTFWNDLARYHGIDRIELINANLRAYGYEEFKAPKAALAVSALPRDQQHLINFQSTGSRQVRATVQESKWFLDKVAHVESEAYGGYDAFNLGGANRGRTSIGAGNSQTDLDKPISTMTLGEIKQRHAAGTLHAVGRYQFTRYAFTDVINKLGLKDDAVFDGPLQDLFALTRAIMRVRDWNQGTVLGLSNEWVGLENYDDATVQRMVGIAQRLPTYMQLHTLTPAAAKALPLVNRN